jgi:hypothetical protein
MKNVSRSTLIVAFIVAGFAVVTVVLWTRSPNNAKHPKEATVSTTEAPASAAKLLRQSVIDTQQATAKPVTSLPPISAEAPGSGSPVPPTEKEDLIRKALEQMKGDYLSRNVHPIYFYGLVVDENHLPVEGAEARFSQTYTGEPAPTKTDSSGRFSLSGVSGRYLSVEVSKAGYYTTKTSRQSFDYSPEGANFQPDLSNPIVFQLRKKGAGAQLVTSAYGVNPRLSLSAPKDGSSVWVDFFNRKMGGEGQMQVSKLTPPYDPNDRSAKEWQITLSIPDGGFVEHNDEFPFEAPQTGYQTVLDFRFTPGKTNWADILRKRYYIAFGQPRKYGWIELETGMYSGIRLQYAINPDGSWYLEPK